MPKTAKEIVQLKLNSLKGKVHFAQQRVIKLDRLLESSHLNMVSLNMVLDNMVFSIDEFVSNFDDMGLRWDQGDETQKRILEGGTSHVPVTQVSNKDAENSGVSDILIRVHKLEDAMSDMRSTIHGGGDGETNRPKGILSHLSVLENSFNEGKDNLLSMEQKIQDISVRQVKLADEVGARNRKEGNRKDLDDVGVTKQFEKLEEKINKTMISDSDRITRLEEKVQTVTSVSDANKSSLAQMSKTKPVNDHKIELESNSVKDRLEKLEERLQATFSDNDTCKKRLQSVEDKLKAVNSLSDTKRDEELKKLQLQITPLDSLTKSHIFQRLSLLENQRVVFGVDVKHSGPWGDGTVIRDVKVVHFNYGNAFQENQCRFLVPTDGVYGLIVYLRTNVHSTCSIKLWSCEASNGGWRDPVFSVSAHGQMNSGESSDLVLVHLRKGEAIRFRAYDGASFTHCTIQGWLVFPGGLGAK